MRLIRSFPAAAWIGLAAMAIALALAFSAGDTPTVSAQVPTPPDACTGVPDSGWNFDFYQACVGHDNCYGQYGGGQQSIVGEFKRAGCDLAFLNAMNNWCNWALILHRVDLEGYGGCRARAQVYYEGVRLFGSAFFFSTNPDPCIARTGLNPGKAC